jgi:hypothetical protein
MALMPHTLHFAYRVRDEMARFVGYALESPLSDGFGDDAEAVFQGAFDASVLMKVLPKFHGSRAKLLEPLVSVLSFAFDPGRPDSERERLRSVMAMTDQPLSSKALLQLPNGARPMLPRTAAKVSRMLYEAVTTGFASFA